MCPAKQTTELSYAVRWRVVVKYVAQLCLVLAALTAVPLAMSMIAGDISVAVRYGMVSSGLAAFGAAFSRLRTPVNIQTNEGIVVVSLMFLITPLLMTFPMMGSGLGFIDAVFETVSGVTTTGLTMTETVADMPQTLLFGRAWMQWYGGLGIIVLSVALFMHPGPLSKGLAVTENGSDDLVGGTRAHARRVLMVYGALTGIGVIGSMLVSDNRLGAVLYTLAAISTGGFAPNDGSLATLDLPEQIWFTLLCVAGATPLALLYRLASRGRRIGVDVLQLKTLLIVALVFSLMACASMWLHAGMAWPQVLHHGPLLAFSAQTTAGFSSMSCSQLDAGSKLILIFSMILGGSAGSTAGGLKLLRLLIVASALRLVLLRTCLPKHAVASPRLAGRRLEDDDISLALLLIVLYVVVVAISWLAFVFAGFGPLDSLFEVVSAIGTVGLSVGVTSPDLPVPLKGVLCADMLLGRLEIVAWLVLVYPRTWFGRRMEKS